MKKQLDLIIIDSFKKEYLGHTPYLSSATRIHQSELEPFIGYQQHLASMFCGCRPDQIDVWSTFTYSPGKSMFGWTKPFSRMKFLNNKPCQYAIDLISYFRIKVNDMIAVRIPISQMSYFDLIMREDITSPNVLPKPTIFDCCRQNDLSFGYFKGGIDTMGKVNFLKNLKHLVKRSDQYTLKLAQKQNLDLKSIYLVNLDGIAHRHGPKSTAVLEHLKKLDNMLKNYMESSDRPVIIVSDHGMVAVKSAVNVLEKLAALDLQPGKDYLVFLDSILARFWFFNNKSEEKITNLLADISEGFIISQQQKQRFGINFKNDKFGHLFFLMKEGYMISPNYFQVEGLPKGMHGYLPSPQENGVLLSNLDMPCSSKPNWPDVVNFIFNYFKN